MVISNMHVSLVVAISFCDISFLAWAQSLVPDLGVELGGLRRSEVGSRCSYPRNLKVTD